MAFKLRIEGWVRISCREGKIVLGRKRNICKGLIRGSGGLGKCKLFRMVRVLELLGVGRGVRL